MTTTIKPNHYVWFRVETYPRSVLRVVATCTEQKVQLQILNLEEWNRFLAERNEPTKGLAAGVGVMAIIQRLRSREYAHDLSKMMAGGSAFVVVVNDNPSPAVVEYEIRLIPFSPEY